MSQLLIRRSASKMSRPISRSVVAISSASDPAWLADAHNPADFIVDMTNTMKMSRIVRTAANHVVVPRRFPNINEYNNTLRWHGRRVIAIPSGLPAPQDQLLTVGDFEIAETLVIPPGVYNIDEILLLINTAAVTLGQVWTFNTSTLSIEITCTAPGLPVYSFGYFTGAPPVGAVFLPLYYLSGGTSELMSTLGLEKAAYGSSVGLSDNVPFDRLQPNTFDTTRGTSIATTPALACFNREAHSFDTWMTANYNTPLLNQPNLAGPGIVHVIVTDLGDSSVINATTGILYDAVASVEMTQVPYGDRVSSHMWTPESESIDFPNSRSVTGFRVRIVDSKFRPLKLPRNCEVNLLMALWFQTD